MRKRIFEIIEVSSEGDAASRVYDWFMMATILVSLIPLATKSTAAWTVMVDRATVVVFILDYVLRVWTADFKLPRRGRAAFFIYPFTPMALIDLLTILPSFGVVGRGARVLRIFRLFRTFKVFRVVEPDTFNTFFDAIYWATISLTTVGYGDIYPVSTAGRIFTMLSSMVGIAVVALPAGIITAGYMDAVSSDGKEK